MEHLVRRVRALLAFALVAGFVLAQATPAAAHVDLAASDPMDGSNLDTSPAHIELTFSASVALAGEGLILIDATGEEQLIAVEQPAEDRLVIVPDASLEDGAYAVSWTVRAGDAHPRSGLIGFTLTSAGPVPPPQPEAAQSETSPAGPSQSETAQSEAGRSDAAGEAVGADGAHVAPNAALAAAALIEAEPPPGDGIARMGRWLSLLGALVGLGVIAFAATTLVGSPREVAEATFWIRRSGVAIVAGTALEVLGTSMMLSGSLLDAILPAGLLAALISAFGVAVVLRIGGGIALLRGTSAEVRPASDRHDGDAYAPVDGAPASSGPALLTSAPITRYRLNLAGSTVAIAGAVAVALSYLFDGHTVTTTPAVVVRLAAVTHVVAAGVWVGGVLMLGRLLAWRRRRGVRLEAAELAVRFSSVAAIALAAVAVAGLALTWAILDSPSELISTPWGRFLLLKLALVGIAVGLGGYNHRFVVPYLDADEGQEAVGDRLRRVVRIEGSVLVGVVAATAALVGAAS